MSPEHKKFVLLPSRRLRAGGREPAATTSAFLRALVPMVGDETAPIPQDVEGPSPIKLRVLDSIREDGPKLVEISEDDARALHQFRPDVEVAPIVYYKLASAEPHRVRAASATFSTVSQPATINLSVRDALSGDAVTGARVVAFTDFDSRLGAEATTDAQGQVSLVFESSPVEIDRLYVYPPLVGYWGGFRQNIRLNSGDEIEVQPVDLEYVDCVRYFHGTGTSADGSGVKVAVIDTGVGPHPNLPNASGDSDNGVGHGTHVAGIIGAHSLQESDLPGLAPGVEIKSYRVFSVPGGLTANFTIAKAIDFAVIDGCDLINLSLKIDNRRNPSGFVVDPVVQLAIEDAREAGVLPIAAAGNDRRQPVDFPARDPLAVAVSAFGRLGTFPSGSNEEGDVLQPFGNDSNNFIAAFSNIGSEIDLTAPGVGVMSTVPGGFGVMSGTSMACPAVVGITARLLSNAPGILNANRDARRSAQIARLAETAAVTLGFPRDHEGRGMIASPGSTSNGIA